MSSSDLGDHSMMEDQLDEISVATDCSGMEAPLQALGNVLRHHRRLRHIFACDVMPVAKKFILLNFPALVFFDDLTKRDNSTIERFYDLYVAGFPCQPFSPAGEQLGFRDPRGKVFFKVWVPLSRMV